jgi:riboflavin kinase/FMN adenylyltransferase
MRHYWSLEDVSLQDTWLTIGTFDGVHRGHQEIIRKLSDGAHAAGSTAVVLTFYPHPAVVLGKRQNPFYLTTPDERATLLGDYGADVVITFPFTPEISNTPAINFVQLLKKHIGMVYLLVGPDFALGHDREGNTAALQEFGVQYGYSLSTIPPVELSGGIVSSSRIRTALTAGDLELVMLLLGRPYFISGQVVPGDGRGKSIGVPTANLSMWMEKALPKSGVYVSQATINGQTFGAVTNIGIRPTFAPSQELPQVETHMFDFSDQIYGQQISVNFMTRLREEKRFPNVQELVDQIRQDVDQAKEYLSTIDS